MGVPAFFRWLQRQYPLIISNCVEARETNGHYSDDCSSQNPNTLGDRDFDCLYLDMNGLIHPCFHPEGNAPPKSEAEIFSNIDKYVLRLFNIVRPKRVLFMAIDGPAPRAKMNQQRMRRFRAAKDAANDRWRKIWKAREEGDTETADFLSRDDYLPSHDSNVITPGTPFFTRLSKHLREFIQSMQDHDPLWSKIFVILSDASVPGEGEHKIMDFVRSQRLERGYDPNTRHVIYGLDADLIFLGLASHEPFFTIMRENILETKEPPKATTPDVERPETPITDFISRPDETPEVVNEDIIGPKQFHFVSLWVLRQYLERDLHPPNLQSLPWNLEYAIDDFVFLCYSCGNDFIPGLPGFSIYSGTVQSIVSLYREKLPAYGAYITRNGMIDFPRFKDFIRSVNDPRGNGAYYYEQKALLQMICPSQQSLEIEKMVNEKTQKEDPDINQEPPKPESDEDKKDKRRRNGIIPREIDGVLIDTNASLDLLKRTYYKMKFQATTEKDVKNIVLEYARGMIWTLNYYLHGSHYWSWYYPYHSAPCSSDWNLLDQDYSLYQFSPGKPYEPLWQLMSVLPPQSAHALPEAMQYLMRDPKSPLIEYYPTTFEVDLEGGTQAYKGHVHVPFIDEKKMESVIKNTNLRLTFDEEMRNKFGATMIFIHKSNAPPVSIEAPHIPINGPLWGLISWCPESDESTTSSHGYIFALRNFPPNQDMSFQLGGIIFPQWAIETIPFGNDQESFWDKGAIDLDDQLDKRIMPLQLPGIIPGQPWNYRERVIERIKARSGMR